jgi:FkbM family methyltransferase
MWINIWRWLSAAINKRKQLIVPAILSGPDDLPGALRPIITFPYDVFGKQINVELEFARVKARWRTMMSGRKEPYTTAWVRENLDENSVFFDVGANVGIYSVLAALHNSPGIRVFAFEPEPNNFLQMCRTIYINNLDIKAYPIAISDQMEVGEFNVNSTFEAGRANHQLNKTTNNHGDDFENVFSLGIVAIPIDDLVEKWGLPAPTEVKIDVDGIELNVLHGMAKTLDSGVIRSISLEVSGKEQKIEAVQFLASKGYVLESEVLSSVDDFVSEAIYRREDLIR